MAQAITPTEGFDQELDLSAPKDEAFEAILVDVDLQPSHASCLIYGVAPDGHSECVEVHGGHSQVRLPFGSRHVCVKYLHGLQQFRIGTIGTIARGH